MQSSKEQNTFTLQQQRELMPNARKDAASLCELIGLWQRCVSHSAPPGCTSSSSSVTFTTREPQMSLVSLILIGFYISFCGVRLHTSYLSLSLSLPVLHSLHTHRQISQLAENPLTHRPKLFWLWKVLYECDYYYYITDL